MSAAAIVSDKQLGDVLLLQPSAAYLAEVLGSPTALFVKEAFRPLIDLMPHCAWGPDMGRKYQQVWTTSWSSRAVWQAVRLRSRRRLLIVNKPRHVRWWYRLAFHDIRLEPPSAEYWARYFWRVVSGLPETDFIPPQLKQPPEEWRHPQLPDDFILINPTAAWERKFWGVSQWAELIGKLHVQHPSATIVIAGGGSEREKAHCQAIEQACGVQLLVNLAGQTTLKQYLHLLAKARFVLCIDGAASHLAQAFGVPAVTIFGPTHEGKWHWPTAQHTAFAARKFNAAQSFGPPSDVPVTAVWSVVLQTPFVR